MDLILNIFQLLLTIFATLFLYKKEKGPCIVYTIIFLGIAILLTVTFIIDISPNKIPMWNAKTTIATITYLSDEISLDSEYDDFVLSIFSKSGRQKDTYYTKAIEYSYIVNDIKYIKRDKLKIDELKNINTKTIEITYNTKNPRDVIIGDNSLNSTDILNITTIIVFIVIGTIFWLRNKTQKNLNSDKNDTIDIAKKGTFLKVLKVQNLDYERKQIFFEDKNNCIYYYETDFSNEFKEWQIYIIKLNRHNQRKTKIDYEGQTIEAIQIVNTEKREFIEFINVECFLK